MKSSKKYSLKFYHILFIGIVFSFSLIIYIRDKNSINIKGSNQEIGKEKFDRNTHRRLESDLNQETENTCKRASQKLRDYYSLKGKEIDISDVEFPLIDNTKEYIGDLIEFIQDKESIFDFAIIYGKHILPIIVFFCISIISLLGWPICCCNCCSCGDCCCCCCCRKSGCKSPCFFLTFLLYIVIMICSLYGVSKTNSVFNSLGDTACSFVQLIKEIKNGEAETIVPRWHGFDKINDSFDKIVTGVNTVKNEKESVINDPSNSLIEITTSELTEKLNDIQIDIKQENHLKFSIPKEKITSSDVPENIDVLLDIIYDYYYIPEETISKKIEKEVIEKVKKPDEIITDSKTNFGKLFNIEELKTITNEAKSSIDKLKMTVSDIYTKYISKIIKHSEIIERYGRSNLKMIFIGLIFIDAGMAVLLLFLIIFGASCCVCCTCVRSLLKFFLHLLWNIMAVAMIILFFGGSILCFISKFGKDLIQVIAVVLGEENLITTEKKPIIIEGDSRTYLYTCIHAQGDFMNDLNLLDPETSPSTESIYQLGKLKDKMRNLLQTFNENLELNSYNEFMAKIQNKIDLREDTSIKEFVPLNPPSITYSLYDFLSILNEYTTTSTNEYNDMWTLSDSCKDSSYKKIEITDDYSKDSSGKTCINIADLSVPLNRYEDEIAQFPTKGYNSVFSAANYYISIIKNINEKLNSQLPSIKTSYTDPDIITQYRAILRQRVNTMKLYQSVVENVMSSLSSVSEGNNNAFDFLNCKFIGRDILIILKNLKEELGDELYNFGIVLLLCASSMAFAIMNTILEIYLVELSVKAQALRNTLKKTLEKDKEIKISSSEEARMDKSKTK